MKKQIKIALTREKSNTEQLIEILNSPYRETLLGTKQLGREEVNRLCNAIMNAAQKDADDIRKDARVAVVKLSAALETTTRLLADAQERLEAANQMSADLSIKRPEA